jgi:hypothetical protein
LTDKVGLKRRKLRTKGLRIHDSFVLAINNLPVLSNEGCTVVLQNKIYLINLFTGTKSQLYIIYIYNPMTIMGDKSSGHVAAHRPNLHGHCMVLKGQ